jgi:DNA-binding CsgD family transcriptional regulator
MPADGHTAHLLWAALERHGAGVILLSAGGQVERVTERARTALAEWFASGPVSLPDVLAQFVASGRSQMQLRDGDRRLVVRRVDADDGVCLLVDEQDVPHAERARRLRLSDREAEVLEQLSAGVSLGATADRLGISLATVRKHLEHVYSKLGVHSQAAAVAVYLMGDVGIE